MKKLILILTVVLISFNTTAQTFNVVNNTCSTINATLFGHDAVFQSCMQLQDQSQYSFADGTTSFFPLPMMVFCWVTQSYPLPTPSATFIPDAIKFSAVDANSCIEYGTVGGCGSAPATITGTCNFCGVAPLQASWTVSGSDITVTFN